MAKKPVDVDQTIRRMKETYRAVAELDGVVESAIGRAVCTLLSTQGEVSRAALFEYFEREIASSPSAQGRREPDTDLERMRAKAVIRMLTRASGGGSSQSP